MRALAQRAAELGKCDLLTAMVGEFPELQGVMGRYYAQHDGEAARSRRSLATSSTCRASPATRCPQRAPASRWRIADKLDTLAGIFAIGQKPTGTRDPFGLRRAALGVLRIDLNGNSISTCSS